MIDITDYFSKTLTFKLCRVTLLSSWQQKIVSTQAKRSSPARAHPSFHSIKQLGASPAPPGWDASPLQGYCHSTQSQCTKHWANASPTTSPTVVDYKVSVWLLKCSLHAVSLIFSHLSTLERSAFKYPVQLFLTCYIGIKYEFAKQRD